MTLEYQTGGGWYPVVAPNDSYRPNVTKVLQDPKIVEVTVKRIGGTTDTYRLRPTPKYRVLYEVEVEANNTYDAEYLAASRIQAAPGKFRIQSTRIV